MADGWPCAFVRSMFKINGNGGDWGIDGWELGLGLGLGGLRHVTCHVDVGLKGWLGVA